MLRDAEMTVANAAEDGTRECSGQLLVLYVEARGKCCRAVAFTSGGFFLCKQLLQVGKGAARVKNGTARLCEKEAALAQCVVLSFKATCRRGVLEERLRSGRVLLAVLQPRGLCSTEALRSCLWPACGQECSGCTFLCDAARALPAEWACEAALGWTLEIRCTECISPVPSGLVLRLLCSGHN